MKWSINNITLVAIVTIAALFRFWNLGTNPPHLTPDEAALGYNAYSILKTGRDEHGEFLPLVFKSFGDYKPGFYIYTAIPFVATLGLNEIAVRMPSAMAGIFAVFLIYKITQTLFANKKYIPIFSAGLLAVSPWHVHFSRGAWETNLALTLSLAGIYFFLKAFKNIKWLVASSVFFALSLYAYQGAKLSTLIVLIALCIAFFSEVKSWFYKKESLKYFLISLSIGFILALPILLSIFQGRAGRLQVFSIFSYELPHEQLVKELNYAMVKEESWQHHLFYSEPLLHFKSILGRWFNHFSGRFLLIDGDWNPRHSSPNQGVILLADILFLVIGFVNLLRIKSQSSRFILLWLVLAPLPAALSRDQIHAVRTLAMVIPLVITISLGLDYTIKFVKDKMSLKLVIFPLLVIMYVLAIVYFIDAVFVHTPIHNSRYWYYGFKQVVQAITPIQKNYSEIFIEQSYDQPYIYFLFYQKYDPEKYQHANNMSVENNLDVGLVGRLDNIYFTDIDWAKDREKKGVVFVADPETIPPHDSNDPKLFNEITEINYLNNKETAFRIIETLKQ